jgi:CRISPR-associated protein Cmr5
MTKATLTREQQRAQHALKSVTQVQAKKFRDEYKSYAESLPANIVINGLGQACAMLLAQAGGENDAHRLLYDHLQDWLCGAEHAAVYPNDKDLVKAVINHGQREYVRAQFESLAYLNWLKKFAQAYLTGEEKQHGEAK